MTWTVPGVVLRVVDADSIWVRLDLGWRIYHDASVRVEGINAPELGTPAGKTARDHVVALLPAGAAVTVVSRCLDKYGRVLGAVRLADGRDLAALLLAAGHAIETP